MVLQALAWVSCARRVLLTAAAAAALASCSPTLRGEVNILNVSVNATNNENWPNGGPTFVHPLVMIVGPPGAISCGLPGPHRPGVPYTGLVDENRTVTVALPSIDDQRNYRTTVRYQCLVRTPQYPQGAIIVRDITSIEYPTRDRRFQPLIVHVGQPDADAPARWQRLRVAVQAQCSNPARAWVCRTYDATTWRDMERLDLGTVSDQ